MTAEDVSCVKENRSAVIDRRYSVFLRTGARHNSEQLIRIDIHGSDDVLRQRKFIQRLAHDPAQAHDRFATHQNVEAELALQFFERRRRRRTPDKLGR